MTKEDLKIVFMGTPEFAVASLKALVENNFNVVGVITMPDKPAGRGYKLQYSAVKQYALEQNLPLLQPTNLKDEKFLEELRALNADLQIVVAFRMLPEVVWDMPRLGTFNLHASLLPKYRGAAPINWSIINGDKETGITTFFLTHEIDTGKIIYQEKVEILPEDNAETLHDKLMAKGAELVVKTTDAIINDSIETIEQEKLISNENDITPAPKIFKETCKINLNQSAENINNFVRGLSPYPAAWSMLHIQNAEPVSVKIFKVAIENDDLNPGKISTDNKSYLKIGTAHGTISIQDLQLAGKKRMKISDFLNGYKLGDNCYFE